MYMWLSLHYSKNCVIACMRTCVCVRKVSVPMQFPGLFLSRYRWLLCWSSIPVSWSLLFLWTGGWASGAEGVREWQNSETPDEHAIPHAHTHTWLLHLCLWGGHKAAKYFPRPRADTVLISQICQKQQRNIRKVMIHISSRVLANICYAKLLSTTAFDNHINFFNIILFQKYINRNNVV